MACGPEMIAKHSSAVIGVVDDDESVRMATSSLLRSANWKVVAYPSASHLLDDTHRSRLKLVVADIHMPGMDGFGLLEAIKQWKRPVPVIFITAFATQELLERANTGGAAGFFSKPVDDERLLALIDEILQT
ncbi:response regulator transcription factor [Paraburkholderia sp. DHOC27]|uniref:response regulator transcription factor n=1 Tax=Paraburkholderia sp. DHOC27 TaxID=2303330 RepID=UPI000E3D981E|nr:response regulator [Paraburkholderia sp. DHOC27]RFU48833.1 response regulator [Paraburkholderia sp. DHOC27]